MLVTAVVLIACLSIFNVILTLAVARRLSSSRTTSTDEPPANRLPDGSPLPEFSVDTYADGPLCRADLQGDIIVGFFSTTCQPCRDQAPEFARTVRTIPGGRSQVLAFVKGGGATEMELVELLSPVARVVTEPGGESGASQEAFGILRWPSYLSVDAAGRITGCEQVSGLALPKSPAAR